MIRGDAKTAATDADSDKTETGNSCLADCYLKLWSTDTILELLAEFFLLIGGGGERAASIVNIIIT